MAYGQNYKISSASLSLVMTLEHSSWRSGSDIVIAA